MWEGRPGSAEGDQWSRSVGSRRWLQAMIVRPPSSGAFSDIETYLLPKLRLFLEVMQQNAAYFS